MRKRNWLLAGALFLSGANLIGLLLPIATAVFAGVVVMSLGRPLALRWGQSLPALLAFVACGCGLLYVRELADLLANLRQLAVVAIALLLVSLLRSEVEDVLERYFKIFTACAAVGLAFYAVAPDFYLWTYTLADRSYLIGPSSRLLDTGELAYSFLGPYRFQGLFEEPGTFSVFSAAAAYWAMARGRRWSMLLLLAATVLSEGVVGIMVLVVLFGWRSLSNVSPARRAAFIALALGLYAAVQAVEIEDVGDLLQIADLLENKSVSGQTRAEQLANVTANWRSLVLPSGFSVNEVLKVSPESITTGYVRAVVPFGLLLWLALLGVLLLAMRRIDLRMSSGILFLAMLVAGTSRVSVFDLFVGWFVLFAVLGQRRDAALRPADRISTNRPAPISPGRSTLALVSD